MGLRQAAEQAAAEETSRRLADPRLTPPARGQNPEPQREPRRALHHIVDNSLKALAAQTMHGTLKRLAGGLAVLPYQSPEVRALRNEVIDCLAEIGTEVRS